MATFLCWLLGHQWVRHITEVRLRDAWAVVYELVDWYHECSRCELRVDRDDPAPPPLGAPVWVRWRARA